MINYGYGMIMNNYLAFPIHVFNQLYLLKKLINPPLKSRYLNGEPTPKAYLTLNKDEIDFFKRFFNLKTNLTKKDIAQMLDILLKYGMKCKSEIRYNSYKRVPNKYVYTLYTGCKFIKSIKFEKSDRADVSFYRFNSYSIVNFFNKFNNEPLYMIQNKETNNDDNHRVNCIADRRNYFLGIDAGLNIKSNILAPYLDIHKYIFYDTVLFTLIKFLKTYILDCFLLKINKRLSFRGNHEFLKIFKNAVDGPMSLNNLIIDAANDTFKSPVFRMNYLEIISVKNYSINKLNQYFTQCLVDRLQDDSFLKQSINQNTN